jgi:hypothetical protein
MKDIHWGEYQYPTVPTTHHILDALQGCDTVDDQMTILAAFD